MNGHFTQPRYKKVKNSYLIDQTQGLGPQNPSTFKKEGHTLWRALLKV
jgi:hypothetical protein